MKEKLTDIRNRMNELYKGASSHEGGWAISAAALGAFVREIDAALAEPDVTLTCHQMEEMVAKQVIADALAAGHKISVWEGEDFALKNSTDADAILKAMFSTDQDHLFIMKDGKQIGAVFFVYGNSGWDVINDYSISLEALLEGTNKLTDRLEETYA